MDKSIEYCRREMLCLVPAARIKQVLLRVTIFFEYHHKENDASIFFYCFDVRITIQASLSFFLSSTYPLFTHKFESSKTSNMCARDFICLFFHKRKQFQFAVLLF